MTDTAPPPPQRVRGAARSALLAAAVVAGCGLPAAVLPHARSTFRPDAPALRRAPLYFYAPADTTRPPRALVFFFGNDVGFWRAHDRLARLLAAHGYAVVGYDVRKALAALPNGPTREAVYLARTDTLLAESRAALGAAAVPLVVAGHSIGGELALWTADHLRAPALAPGLAGVVSLSPGARGHLRTGVSDLRGDEPHEPGSFAVDSQVAGLTPRVRVALVRGTGDHFGYADSAIVAAGAVRFPVEGGKHSLRDLGAVGPVVLRALDFVLGGAAPARTGER